MFPSVVFDQDNCSMLFRYPSGETVPVLSEPGVEINDGVVTGCTLDTSGMYPPEVASKACESMLKLYSQWSEGIPHFSIWQRHDSRVMGVACVYQGEVLATEIESYVPILLAEEFLRGVHREGRVPDSLKPDQGVFHPAGPTFL